MGSLIIINVLIHTHNDGSPVTSSICLKPNIYYSPYNPSGGLAVDID